jgi:hypothetical protein
MLQSVTLSAEALNELGIRLLPLDELCASLSALPGLSVTRARAMPHDALWVSSAGHSERVETCLVKVLHDVDTGRPAMWRLWCYDMPLRAAVDVVVHLMPVAGAGEVTRTAMVGCADDPQYRKTSLPQLDLSDGRVPVLAREVLGRALALG